MKKILILFICITSAYGADTVRICTKNTTIEMLDVNFNGTSYSGSKTEQTFKTNFTWGMVSGVCYCSEESGLDPLTQYTGPNAAPTNDTDQADAKYCWMRMTYPANGYFVRSRREYDTATKCSINCCIDTGYDVRYFINVRQQMFEIAQ